MKRGIYEKPGIRFGWVCQNRGGYLFGEIRSTRRELIRYIETEFNLKWRTIRRRYGTRIVFVKMEVIEL